MWGFFYPAAAGIWLSACGFLFLCVCFAVLWKMILSYSYILVGEGQKCDGIK